MTDCISLQSEPPILQINPLATPAQLCAFVSRRIHATKDLARLLTCVWASTALSVKTSRAAQKYLIYCSATVLRCCKRWSGSLTLKQRRTRGLERLMLILVERGGQVEGVLLELRIEGLRGQQLHLAIV